MTRICFLFILNSELEGFCCSGIFMITTYGQFLPYRFQDREKDKIQMIAYLVPAISNFQRIRTETRTRTDLVEKRIGADSATYDSEQRNDELFASVKPSPVISRAIVAALCDLLLLLLLSKSDMHPLKQHLQNDFGRFFFTNWTDFAPIS